MPTESNEINPGKLMYKDQEGNIKELSSYEFKGEEQDDEIDALRYAVKLQKEMQEENNFTRIFPIKTSRSIQKLLGIEKITRKRFIKLLMAFRIQRNEAEQLAYAISKSNLYYSPVVVQAILEWILKKYMLKEKEQ